MSGVKVTVHQRLLSGRDQQRCQRFNKLEKESAVADQIMRDTASETVLNVGRSLETFGTCFGSQACQDGLGLACVRSCLLW